MNFGFKEMDEQLIEDWISSLLHLSKIQSATYLAKKAVKEPERDPWNSGPTQFSEVINTNEGFNIWKKVPLKDRLLCLRAMKLFRQCLGNYYSDLSHLPEETKNTPIHELAANYDKVIVEFMSFLRSHHDIHANYRDYKHKHRTGHSHPPVHHFHKNNTNNTPDQQSNDIPDESELDDIEYSYEEEEEKEENLENGENEAKQNENELENNNEEESDNDEDAVVEDASPAPVSPRQISEKGSEKSDAHDWQESFTPTINDLLEYLHDFIYEKTERYIKVLTPWMKQQAFSIFQQLLEQYGEEKVILEVHSYQSKNHQASTLQNENNQPSQQNKTLYFLIDPDFTQDSLNQSKLSENNNHSSSLRLNLSNPSFASPLSSYGNISTSFLSSSNSNSMNNGRIRKSWKSYFINLLKDCFYNFIEKEQISTKKADSSEEKKKATIPPHHFQGLLLWQENANNLGFHSLLELLEKELVAFHEQQEAEEDHQPPQSFEEYEQFETENENQNVHTEELPQFHPHDRSTSSLVEETTSIPLSLSPSQNDLLLQPIPKRTSFIIENPQNIENYDEIEENEVREPFPATPKSIQFADEIVQIITPPDSPKGSASSSSSSSTEEIISKIYLPRDQIYYLPPVAIQDGSDLLLLRNVEKNQKLPKQENEIEINENPFLLSNQAKLGISWMRLLTTNDKDGNENRELLQPLLTSKDIQNIFWFESAVSSVDNLTSNLPENQQPPEVPATPSSTFNLGLSLVSPAVSFYQQQSQLQPTTPQSKKESELIPADQISLSNLISESLASNKSISFLLERKKEENEEDDKNGTISMKFQLVSMEHLENPSISSFSQNHKKNKREDNHDSDEEEESDPFLFSRQGKEFYQIKPFTFPSEMNASSSFTLRWKRNNIRTERKRNSISSTMTIDPSTASTSSGNEEENGKDFLFLVWDSSIESDLLEDHSEKFNILSWIPLSPSDIEKSNSNQLLYSLKWNGQKGKLFDFSNYPLLTMEQFQKELEAQLFQQMIDKKLEELELLEQQEKQQRKGKPNITKKNTPKAGQNQRNNREEGEERGGNGAKEEEDEYELEREKHETNFSFFGVFTIPKKYIQLITIIYALLYASKLYSAYISPPQKETIRSSYGSSHPSTFSAFSDHPTVKEPRKAALFDKESEEFKNLPEILQNEDSLLDALPPVANPDFDLSSLFSHIDSIKNQMEEVQGQVDPSLSSSPPSANVAQADTVEEKKDLPIDNKETATPPVPTEESEEIPSSNEDTPVLAIDALKDQEPDLQAPPQVSDDVILAEPAKEVEADDKNTISEDIVTTGDSQNAEIVSQEVEESSSEKKNEEGITNLITEDAELRVIVEKQEREEVQEQPVQIQEKEQEQEQAQAPLVSIAVEEKPCDLCDDDEKETEETNEQRKKHVQLPKEEETSTLATISKFLMVYVVLFGLILIFVLTLKPSASSPSPTSSSSSPSISPSTSTNKLLQPRRKDLHIDTEGAEQ